MKKARGIDMDTKKLRQKILDLAIRGKLVPQDPNDEPASVLLERIRAEKERLIKEGKIKRSKKSASDTPRYENVPFEVPGGWEWCKLIDVCHIFGRIGFRGYTKDDIVSNDGAITLSPSNIIDGQMNYSNCTYISWEKYEESPEIQIANGDILLVKTGSSFGKCAFVKDLPQEATINPQFVVLKFIACNPQFLTFILQSGYARHNYDEFVLGTAIPTFTQVVLGDMYIPLPSIQEQTRIVAAINKWFALIDTLETEKEDLQTFIAQTKSKILDLAIHGKLVPQDPNDEPAIELLKRINPKFTPCDNAHKRNHIPNSWIWCTLQDSFDITMGSSPTGDTLNRDNHGIEFHQGKVFFSDRYIQLSDIYTTQPIKIAEPQSILLCVRAPVGTVNITDRQICIGRGLCSLKPSKIIDLLYAYYVLQTCSEELEQKATGSTFKAVGGDVVKNQIIPLPPINEQRRIVAKIEGLYSVLDEIQKSIEA